MASKKAVLYVGFCHHHPLRADSCWYSSLYRRSLKLALDWAVHRQLWRGQALYIRSLFEANRNVTNPRQQRVSCYIPTLLVLLSLQWRTIRLTEDVQALLRETEKLL